MAGFDDILSGLEGILTSIPGLGPIVQAFTPPPALPAPATVQSALAANPATANLGATGPQTLTPPLTQVASPAPLTIAQDIGSIIKAVIGSVASNPTQAANLLQALERYQLQQKLLDPNYIASQAAKLNKGLSAPLKRDITQTTEAQMAGMGLGGAPNLMRESIARALAPYEYNAQQNALQQYLASIGVAEGTYPQGGPLGDFSNFLSQVQTEQSKGGPAAATGFGP